jgi:hypothetical protein
VRAQLKVLLDEMDNTKEEGWPSEKTPSSGAMDTGACIVLTFPKTFISCKNEEGRSCISELKRNRNAMEIL